MIDDHALVREGLRQVLKGLDENVSVLQAGTCEMAFALADSHADIDLVLLDYHLPDMTGLQALDHFGKQHPELPIVMLSGSANLQIMRQVLQSGASGFVTKSSLNSCTQFGRCSTVTSIHLLNWRLTLVAYRSTMPKPRLRNARSWFCANC